MPDLQSFRIEERTALRTAAARLKTQFEGVFGTETIERFLQSSYDELDPHAKARNFLPLFAERFARQRLRALSRIEGREDGTSVPIVLFLCVHNAGRSQIALGWLEHLAGQHAVAWSGGTVPGDEVNKVCVAAMAEVGIDISGEFPKPWTDEVVRAADVVVTMGCGDACPIFPGKVYEDWAVPDLLGMSLEELRPVRDDIGRRVRDLLYRLDVPLIAGANA